MKRMIFLMLTLLIWSTASMNAQVLIGTGDNPNPSAVLELKSANLGFLFPRVALQSTEDKETIASPATGLTVYNTTATGNGTTFVVPGIYVFNGTAWTLQAPPVITTQPAAFTFRRLHNVNGDPNAPTSVPEVNLNVVATGATNYQWYKKAKNVNAPATAIVGATSAGYNPTSTLTAWGLYQYYCVVSNAYGSVKSETADVAVGCGAKTTEGGWLSFMCQNLGAANAVYTNDESTGYGLDDISFQFGTDATNKIDNDAKGYLFQWGRNGKGTDTLYQSRSSAAIAGPAPLSSVDGTLVKGEYATKFIIANTAPYNWSTQQDVWLWQESGTAPNPCPSGWRVPSQNDWGSIFNSTAYGTPDAGTANSWIWKNGTSGTGPGNGNGYKIKPNGVYTTLFLPAAGARTLLTGAVFANDIGYYYSSTRYVHGCKILFFYATGVAPNTPEALGNGFSVRCVKSLN